MIAFFNRKAVLQTVAVRGRDYIFKSFLWNISKVAKMSDALIPIMPYYIYDYSQPADTMLLII